VRFTVDAKTRTSSSPLWGTGPEASSTRITLGGPYWRYTAALMRHSVPRHENQPAGEGLSDSELALIPCTLSFAAGPIGLVGGSISAPLRPDKLADTA